MGKRAELYEGRVTSYFVLACVVGSLGGSLFGYDLGVSGTVFCSVILRQDLGILLGFAVDLFFEFGGIGACRWRDLHG